MVAPGTVPLITTPTYPENTQLSPTMDYSTYGYAPHQAESLYDPTGATLGSPAGVNQALSTALSDLNGQLNQPFHSVGGLDGEPHQTIEQKYLGSGASSVQGSIVGEQDLAVTGLLMEHRLSAVVLRYRVTNLGSRTVTKPFLVRLTMDVKDRGKTLLADTRIEGLEAGETKEFVWSGDTISQSFWLFTKATAKVEIVLSDGLEDANLSNNQRSAKLSYY